MRINWQHKLSRGLVFAHLLNHKNALYIKGGRVDDCALTNAAPRPIGASGVGLGNTGYVSGAWGGFSVPQSSGGTAVFHTRPDFTGGSGVNKGLCSTPSGWFVCEHFTDGNLYLGWRLGTRAQFNVTGMWSAGETFTIGVTWSGTSTVGYVKGIARNTAANTSFGGAGDAANLVVGLWGAVWSSSGDSGVHSGFIWDRVLRPDEMLTLEHDPYCFLEPDMPALWFAPTIVADSFFFQRRHLAHLRR